MSIGQLKRELDRLLPLDAEARQSRLQSLQENDPTLHEHLLSALAAADNQTTFLRPTLPGVAVRGGVAGRPVEVEDGRVIAGRYRIGQEIGRGTFAVVYLALDQVLDRNVAIKVFRVEEEQAFDRVRREAAALRLLRLPGVVEIFDDARDGDLAFIVMDFIQGKPFPGHLPLQTWESLEKRLVGLLQILARIHWAGVIHCDLKPSNVLVGVDGGLHVLDLGISRCEALDQESLGSDRLAGTLAYMAPELWDGVAPRPCSDLYSVGIMLQRAMAANELLEGNGAETVPDFVTETLLPGLLAEGVERRFETAADALELLLPVESMTRSATAETIEQLEPRVLFAGSDRLHWIPTDASAALVHECIETDRAPMDVLLGWTRSGWGRWEDGRYHVTRSSLEQLGQRMQDSTAVPMEDPIHDDAHEQRPSTSTGGEDSTGGESSQGGAPTEPVDSEPLQTPTATPPQHDAIQQFAYDTAQDLLRKGNLNAAILHIEQGLGLDRMQPDRLVSAQACSLLLQWALAAGTRKSIHRTLYELKRFPDSDRLRPFESVARAGLLAMDGDVSGTLDLLDQIKRIEDPDGDMCVQSIRAFASRCSPDPVVHETAMTFLEAWAMDSAHPDARGAERDWAGWFHYFNGDYVLAGTFQEEASVLLDSPIRRLSALLNAATSYLEGERYDDARRLASTALHQASGLRHPHYAGRAEWILRSADYRIALDKSPDLELIEAAAQLEVPHLYAQLCLNEAAFAWRRSDLPTATDLARRATQSFANAGDPAAGFLARAFLYSLLSDDSIALPDLQAALSSCPMPLLALQALALLASANIQKPWATQAAQPLLANLSTSLSSRREILSLSECRTLLI